MLRLKGVWIQINLLSVSEVWSCGMPCETFQGQGESWNQEIIKSVCSQFHGKMRLKQKIHQFQQHWYHFKVMLGKFCKEIASRTLKNELHCHLDSKAQSSAIRQRHLHAFRGYLSLFDVRMRNSSVHRRWKSPECLPLLLCWIQGPGLSTHTKWENCQSAWLPSLKDGWTKTKPPYYYFLLSM